MNLQRYQLIDVGRFFAAFLVVTLHVKFPVAILAPYVWDFAKIAVPFFFIVSGYFLFDTNTEVVRMRAGKILVKVCTISFFATIVYVLFRIFKNVFFGVNICSQNFDLIKFVFANDASFTEHLWYLYAYIYVLLLVLLFIYFDWFHKLTRYFSVLLVFYICGYVIALVDFENSGLWTLNWLVTGLPFVVLGFAIKKNQLILSHINLKVLLGCVLVLIVCLYAEHYLFKALLGRGPGVVSVLFLSFVVFILSINSRLNIRLSNSKFNNFLAKWGRLHSLNIYIIHILIRDLIIVLRFPSNFNNSIVVFVFSLLCSMIFVGLLRTFRSN